MCSPTIAEIASQMGGRSCCSKRLAITFSITKCLRPFDKALDEKSLLSYLKILSLVGFGDKAWRQSSSSFVGETLPSFYLYVNSSAIDLRARSLSNLALLPIYSSPSTRLICSNRGSSLEFRLRDRI
jgi:hypothetical protein